MRLRDDGILRHRADVPGLTDVLSSVNKEMLDDHEQHLDVVLGQVILALLLVALQSRAVVGGEEGLDIRCGLFDQKAQ